MQSTTSKPKFILEHISLLLTYELTRVSKEKSTGSVKSTDVGETYLACALGHEYCLQGKAFTIFD